MSASRLVVPKSKPRPTYLYLIREEHGLYKVGIAQDVDVRLSTLQSATPYTLTVCVTVAVKNALQAESFVHSALTAHHVRGEWFQLPDEQSFHDAVKKYKAALRKPHLQIVPQAEPWQEYSEEIREKLLRRG